VNVQHAEVIREIFRRHAGGEGLRTIAKDLNQRGVSKAQGRDREPPAAIATGGAGALQSLVTALKQREETLPSWRAACTAFGRRRT
jgi:hypothetical protein